MYVKAEFNQDHKLIQFLDFAKADNRLYGDRDFLGSVKSRLSIMNMFYHEFLNAIPAFEEEQIILAEKKYVDGISRFVLVVKYETFLNSVYSLMEIFAFVYYKLSGDKSMPRSFRKQKEWLLKRSYVDEKYTEILRKTTWYKEVHEIRSEATHYLTGLIVSYSNGIPGYLNFPISERTKTHNKIEVYDIKQHVDEIMNGLKLFFDNAGEYFLDKINKDSRILHLCCFTENMGLCLKLYSYNEMINKEPGVCASYEVDCPKAEGCIARKNTETMSVSKEAK